jgi:AraC-like DNA-binding protein
MLAHLTERMQVSALASLIHVSPSYYFALFKRETGYAPIDFFIHLRMRRACRLLETTTLSVKEIADELGYDDAFYFSRLFKSVTSLAPTDYRLLKRNSRESIAQQVLPERFLTRDLSAPRTGNSEWDGFCGLRLIRADQQGWQVQDNSRKRA